MRRSALTAVLAVSALLGPLGASGDAQASPAGTTTSASSGNATALADGDPGAGRLGGEWSAASSDASPWVQLTFSSTQRIASVQVFGSTADAFDPKQSTAAALYGTLRFSDGSTVVVSGIAPGAGMPTTVAFTPRTTSWVRLELRRQIGDAPFALRELQAYPVGTTPPQWRPTAVTGYSATPTPAASCASTASSGPSVAAALPGRLTLACPTPGSAVTDTAVVAVNAPAGAQLTAYASYPSSSAVAVPLRRAASAVAGADGRAVLTAEVRELPQGPFALKVTATGPTSTTAVDPLYVQLFRTDGSPSSSSSPSATTAPAGMTLQYSDDFDGPLSVSQSGWGAQYAALKPEPWGGSQFGEAVFADPAKGAGTLATLPGGYLRVRAQPIGSLVGDQTWGQPHAAGILSSQRFGGSGFSAQGGYFEARMMGAPGRGSWPAFWMFNTETGTGRADGTGGELDAVELYGHDTRGGCQTTHSWGASGGDTGAKSCQRYPADWAAEWHVYGVKVVPGGAEFYLDGRRIAALDRLSHTDEPFFFMLDLATGGGWPVDLAATGQTTDLYVDWVRVYT